MNEILFFQPTNVAKTASLLHCRFFAEIEKTTVMVHKCNREGKRLEITGAVFLVKYMYVLSVKILRIPIT